jgi:hypothetical protein
MRIGRAASMCLYVIVFLCAGAVRVAPAQVASRTGAVKEYQLKSVFLFNFAQFVDWPADAFADAQAPLVIGVLGDDPFGPFLDETVRGEHVNGRSLVVRRYRRLEDVKNCHILFVSRSESEQLPAILAGLKGRSILTVGDMPDFAVNGGMIRFVNEKNRIRLSINLDAAKSANVTISSKLLRPAEIVTTTKE